MPKCVRGQNFAHHFHIADVTDHNDDNRQIAGNALPPKCALTFRASAETRGWRPQLSLWKKDVGCQLAESLKISWADVESAHFKLGMSPGCLEGASAGMKLRVAFRQPDHSVARLRDYGYYRKVKPLIRQDCYLPAQAEDRVEDGANPLC